MPQTVLHPLAPLITAESHTLILGTMPSPRSRAETFYYAHPQNRFWPVIAALYGEEDPKTSEGRAELLLSHGLALWDVLASCTITGAADSTIRDPIPNDIPGLLRQYPGITRIAATGSTAIGSCNALPSRWKKPKIFILFPLREPYLARLKPYFYFAANCTADVL